MKLRDWLTTTEPGQVLLFVSGIVAAFTLFIVALVLVGA